VTQSSLVGREYPPVEFTIEAEPVAKFARALGIDPVNGVPPTYAAVYALFTTVPQLFQDQEAAIDLGRLLHAEQEFEWERHPEVGETVTASGRVISDAVRRGVRLIGFETRCSAGDEALCRSRALFIIRPLEERVV
jgi:N-terminal half of MaoC dehydratase